MGIFKSLSGTKETPIKSNDDFENWFQYNEKANNKNRIQCQQPLKDQLNVVFRRCYLFCIRRRVLTYRCPLIIHFL